MKNAATLEVRKAKAFAKRIIKARQSLSVMGEMMIQFELDAMSLNELLDTQDALANMKARNYKELEDAIARVKAKQC